MDDMVKDVVLSPDNKAEDNEVITKAVKHYDDTNEVQMEGTVASVYEAGSIVLLTVLTNTGRTGQETSGLTVSADNDLAEAAKKFKPGNRVKIEGKVFTRRARKKDPDEPDRYEPAVRATKIEAAVSKMDEKFGLEGRSYGPSYNRITLVGDIFRMTQITRNTATVVLQVREKDEKPRNVEVTIFANNLKKLIPQLVIGNRVIMICEYRVRKKERDGQQPEYFRNLVLMDMKEV